MDTFGDGIHQLDQFVCELQMVGSDFSGDRQSGRLRPGNDTDCGSRGNMLNVIAAPGQFRETNVTFHDDRLSQRWQTDHAQPR